MRKLLPTPSECEEKILKQDFSVEGHGMGLSWSAYLMTSSQMAPWVEYTHAFVHLCHRDLKKLQVDFRCYPYFHRLLFDTSLSAPPTISSPREEVKHCKHT